MTANVTVYDTEIKDFQAQVVNASVGVLRGYLANAEKVRVRGAEFDGSARRERRSLALRRRRLYRRQYVSFTDAPPPLEETGGPQVKDISGSLLPGISKWALSVGGEYVQRGSRVRPVRTVLRRRSTPATARRSRRAPAPRRTWSSMATRCSTRGSASARGGLDVSSGRATCSTRTTSTCSPRRRATPASMSASRAIRGPLA